MSIYIKLSTLAYPRHAGDIEIDPAGVSDYAGVVQTPKPQYDPKLQKCVETTPTHQDGAWRMVWEIQDLTQEEIDKHLALLNHERLG